jgi:plasmid stabilization system protein ParE
MSRELDFKLHPEAAKDITEIWQYIAADSPLAAQLVREEIARAIRMLVPFPHQARSHRPAFAISNR